MAGMPFVIPPFIGPPALRPRLLQRRTQSAQTPSPPVLVVTGQNGQFFDMVMETTTTYGTGPVTLLGNVTGYITVASRVADTYQTQYKIQELDASGRVTANWEIGTGTYYASGNILTRDLVQASSNSDALVDFPNGTTKRVSLVLSAAEIMKRPTLGQVLAMPKGFFQ